MSVGCAYGGHAALSLALGAPGRGQCEPIRAFLVTPRVQDHADCFLVSLDYLSHVTTMMMLSLFLLVIILSVNRFLLGPPFFCPKLSGEP